MELTNQRNTPRKCRCIYCGSTAYGKGCKFAPHGVHFHPDDARKCSYCGSNSYGKGCKINPTSDLHVHGINYNSMFKEQVQSFLDSKILLEEIKKDYTKFACFKYGIIDDKGNKIKEPITEEERESFGPMVRTIIRLKKYLGPKIDLLDASNNLKSNSIPLQENIIYYTKILNFQKKLDTLMSEVYKTLDEAQDSGVSLDDIKKILSA